MKPIPPADAARAYLQNRKRLRGVDAWDIARRFGILNADAAEMLLRRRLELGEITLRDLTPAQRRALVDPSHLDLHAIAAMPIMDPNEIYLPAGRISLEEAKAREAAAILKS